MPTGCIDYIPFGFRCLRLGRTYSGVMNTARTTMEDWRVIVNAEGRRSQKAALWAWRNAVPLKCMDFVTAVGFIVEIQCSGPWRSPLSRWSRLLMELLQCWAAYNMEVWYPRGRLGTEALLWCRTHFTFTPTRR